MHIEIHIAGKQIYSEMTDVTMMSHDAERLSDLFHVSLLKRRGVDADVFICGVQSKANCADCED